MDKNVNMQLKVLRVSLLPPTQYDKNDRGKFVFGGKKIQFPNYVQLNLTTFIFNKTWHFQSIKMSCFLSIKQIQVNCFFW